jgi:multidrug efflux pump subunit AcrA (membrane-fusion protein)
MTKSNAWKVALALTVLLTAAAAWMGRRSEWPQAQASESTPVRLPVETALLESADAVPTTRTFSGVIKAARTSDLGFKRAGRVEQVLVRAGQLVRQGEVLATLDSRQVQADLEQARASCQAAEAQLAEALAGPRIETIQAARAQVADSQAEVKLWAARLARQEDLHRSGASSVQEFDDSRFQWESATNRLERFQRQLEELEAGTRAEQIAVFRAGVAQWQATVERLEVEVADSDLLAPYDAVVGRRDIDEGVVISPGATVVRLVEQRAIEAWMGVPPDYLQKLPESSHHKILVGQQTYLASIRDVLPEVDTATRTQTVVFSLAPSVQDELPLPGQLARLALSIPDTTEGYWVPTTALTRGQRGLWAMMVLGPDGETLQRRDVELLQVDTAQVRVRGLIQAGERYVTTGLHRVTAGQQVQSAPVRSGPGT